jgi:tetratricopeptide (TPR) repeat protein
MAETHRDDIAKLEALYAENPEGRVFIHLAEAYRRAGELDRALEVVKDGISRYAEDSSAHVVLGRVLEDRQEDDEATEAFRRVLDLDAHNLVALRGLGDLAFRAGHHQAALEYFERLAELEPPDGELEALIEALRSGPAGMAEAKEQWEAPVEAPQPADAGSRPEAVDFAGGTLDAGSAVAPEAPAGADDYAAPPVADETSGLGEGEPATPAAMAPEPTETPVEEKATERLATWDPGAPAEPTEASSPADEPEAAPVAKLEGLETEEELRGAEAAGDVAPLGVTERDFHEPVPEETQAPDIGGVEGLQTEERSASGEPLPGPPMPWEAGYEAEDDAAEETQTVFTETMAQVYARQGLYDRAADVYRELLRQRPGDPALETRLAEMQELQSGTGAETVAQAPETASAEEPFPFLDAEPTAEHHVEEAGTLEGEVWEPGYADEEATESPEAAAGPEEREFAETPPVAEEQEPAEEPEAARETGLAEGAAVTGEAAFAPEAELAPEPESGRESAAGAAEPYGEPVAMEGSAAAEPASTEEVAEDVESVWTGAGGAVAGAETPYSWTEPAEEEPADEAAGEGIRSYLMRLAGWAPGARTGMAAPGASEPEAVQEVEGAQDAPDVQDAGAVQDAQVAGEAGAGRPPGGADASPGEDDDLDMFRSWLESLKR